MDKPGIKTTEFWASIATSVFGLLVTLGVFTPEQGEALKAAATEVAGAILTAAPIVGYAISRGKAKGGM